MLNAITIQGRLTKPPEMRTTQAGVQVANFTLACDSDFDREHTDFITCVAWKNTAEFVNKYFQKGMLVLAEGRLQSRKWTDKEGKPRTEWEVQCSRVHFCESKKSTESAQAEEYAQRGQYGAKEAPRQQFTPVEDEDDLPF